MKRFRLLGVSVLVVFVVGVMFASVASASLPTVLAEKETLGTGTVTGETFLETEFEKLEGKGVTLEMTVLAGNTHLGKYLALFTNVKEAAGEKNKCTTSGDTAGDVHISGEWHLVYIALGTGEALKVGLLLLVTPAPQEFVCGTIKAKVEGSVLASVLKLPASGTKFVKLGGDLKCVKVAKQQQTKYWNEAGTAEVSSALKAKLGAGNEKACQNVAEELVVTFNHEIAIDY